MGTKFISQDIKRISRHSQILFPPVISHSPRDSIGKHVLASWNGPARVVDSSSVTSGKQLKNNIPAHWKRYESHMYQTTLYLTVISFWHKVLENIFPFFALRKLAETRQLSFRTISADFHIAAGGIFATSGKKPTSPEMLLNTPAPLLCCSIIRYIVHIPNNKFMEIIVVHITCGRALFKFYADLLVLFNANFNLKSCRHTSR